MIPAPITADVCLTRAWRSEIEVSSVVGHDLENHAAHGLHVLLFVHGMRRALK